MASRVCGNRLSLRNQYDTEAYLSAKVEMLCAGLRERPLGRILEPSICSLAGQLVPKDRLRRGQPGRSFKAGLQTPPAPGRSRAWERDDRPNPLLLEKGGRAASPGLGFFLGDFLQVGHVRTGLREHVMQIVADADESETLVQEFADSRGAKEEQTENYVVLARVFDQALGGGVQFGRSVHVREFVFFIEAHGHAEIVLAEEENVDARDRGDFRDVLDAVGGFDLQGDDAVVVPIAGVAQKAVFVHAALRKIDRARAGGGILRAADRLARFRGAVDVGDEHAVGTKVEGLLDAAPVVVALDAHQRFCAAAGDPGKHGRELFKAHGAVLGVYEQPVVAGMRELLGDGWTVGVQEQAHLRLACAQLLFEIGTVQFFCGHDWLLDLKEVRMNWELRELTHYTRKANFSKRHGRERGRPSVFLMNRRQTPRL